MCPWSLPLNETTCVKLLHCKTTACDHSMLSNLLTSCEESAGWHLCINFITKQHSTPWLHFLGRDWVQVSTTWKLTLRGPKFTLQEGTDSLKAIDLYLLTPPTFSKHTGGVRWPCSSSFHYNIPRCSQLGSCSPVFAQTNADYFYGLNVVLRLLCIDLYQWQEDKAEQYFKSLLDYCLPWEQT